ncbi:cilium assembly protein DZIP1 isoform X1 [Salarias fasciatus]|uniref:cilium assembly protein DZIP1 isoform X1 n=1 Tax=Salarias fasciatus TaxID=181472 RepID=UPI0011765A5B|nr:zinc finger protein Dzip1-like isoform X1 [Salarias fasciatus]XP_029941781.1 zinc finger protein Dzip1-like isoform X1 [Salarias fasciatus]
MPFQDGVYYPLSSDTHSSAGIPSLLNSPLSVMTPSSGNNSAAAAAAAGIPFKFRPRRESVDWRRINAVDVDLVVSQLDVDALQEHVGTVTFCSLEGERCPRCQGPVDPALVKLLRLAQLTVEWLLHCQEFLALNLRAAEERLAAAGRERDELLERQRGQEEKAKALMAELKQRKKVIRTQQSLLAPRIISHKCLHCEKTFMNSSFLQNHVQRRHPDEFDAQLRSDSEKKSQIDSLKSEISSLKEQVVQQQQALQAKAAQEKEQQSMHKDLLRELDRFKAEEMARMDRKIEDSRDGMRKEMEFLYSRNIQALNEVSQSQSVRQEKEKSLGSAPSQPERDVDSHRDEQIHKLQLLMNKQNRKWESRLQEMKSQHESEKIELHGELNRMRSSVLEQQERSQEMMRKLQEKEQTVRAQRDQIKSISSKAEVTQVPVVVNAPPPEPKQKRVVLEEPVSALKLDPIQELSEEDRGKTNAPLHAAAAACSAGKSPVVLSMSVHGVVDVLLIRQARACRGLSPRRSASRRPAPHRRLSSTDSSSVSERRPAERKAEAAPEKKQRPSSRSSSSSRNALKTNPNIKREMRPELEEAVTRRLESLGVRPDQSALKSKDLASVRDKVKLKRETVAKEMPDYWRQREEIRSAVEKKLSAQTKGSDPTARRQVQVLQIRPRSSSLPSRPAAKQPKTPQPAPRTKTASTPPKTSTPNTAALRIPAKTPPFSSDEESEDRPASRQVRGSRGGPRQAAVSRKQSDDDDGWSDVSELQEIDPQQLGRYRDQNGNLERRNPGKENRINDLARKMEKQFAERVLKKPAGGVSILPEKKDEVQELTYTDLEESSDWVVSSLEDKPGPLRKSLDSPSTSVWGTSTGKAPRSGLTEAGTGSTLKSSLCSLSDISDSDDASNRPGKY